MIWNQDGVSLRQGTSEEGVADVRPHCDGGNARIGGLMLIKSWVSAKSVGREVCR